MNTSKLIAVPDIHAERGDLSLIPATARVSLKRLPDDTWEVVPPKARFAPGVQIVSFGPDDQLRMEEWARDNRLDITWPTIRQAIVDQAILEQQRLDAEAAKRDNARAERQRIHDLKKMITLELVAPGYWTVTRRNGTTVGTVRADGAGFSGIHPDDAWQNPVTAPPASSGRTPLEAAAYLALLQDG